MELVVVVLVAAAGCFLILIIEQLAILYNMHYYMYNILLHYT